MDWKQVGDAVKSFAPDIAMGLSGPPGWLALATKYIGKALGTDITTPEQAMKAIVAMTPEQSLALKTESDNFKAHMMELGVKLTEVNEAGTANARELQKKGGKWANVIDGFMIVSLTVEVIVILLNGMPDDPAVATLLSMVIGAQLKAIGDIVHFWRGSSKGSQDKDETVANLSRPS